MVENTGGDVKVENDMHRNGEDSRSCRVGVAAYCWRLTFLEELKAKKEECLGRLGLRTFAGRIYRVIVCPPSINKHSQFTYKNFFTQ